MTDAGFLPEAGRPARTAPAARSSLAFGQGAASGQKSCSLGQAPARGTRTGARRRDVGCVGAPGGSDVAAAAAIQLSPKRSDVDGPARARLRSDIGAPASRGGARNGSSTTRIRPG